MSFNLLDPSEIFLNPLAPILGAKKHTKLLQSKNTKKGKNWMVVLLLGTSLGVSPLATDALNSPYYNIGSALYPKCNNNGDKCLNVPYASQVRKDPNKNYDTGDNLVAREYRTGTVPIGTVNDTVAQTTCGPTSMAMILSYYGKISPSQEAMTQAVYGEAPYSDSLYFCSLYSYNGQHNSVGGLLGALKSNNSCLTGANHPYNAMLDKYGLSIKYGGGFSFDEVKKAIDQGSPLFLSYASWGHIAVIIGYNNSDKSVIINDPIGNPGKWMSKIIVVGQGALDAMGSRLSVGHPQIAGSRIYSFNKK